MNKGNVLKLADLIEQQPDTEVWDEEGFCMRSEVHNCGSPACIMGFAAYLQDEQGYAECQQEENSSASDDVYPLACAYLELAEDKWSEGIANCLFYPELETAHFCRSKGEKGYISAKRAARTLRHLAETGRISWSA